MPRRNNNAQRRIGKIYNFKQLCKKIGISPLQRVVIIRYVKSLKGGATNGTN